MCNVRSGKGKSLTKRVNSPEAPVYLSSGEMSFLASFRGCSCEVPRAWTGCRTFDGRVVAAGSKENCGFSDALESGAKILVLPVSADVPSLPVAGAVLPSV